MKNLAETVPLPRRRRDRSRTRTGRSRPLYKGKAGTTWRRRRPVHRCPGCRPAVTRWRSSPSRPSAKRNWSATSRSRPTPKVLLVTRQAALPARPDHPHPRPGLRPFDLTPVGASDLLTFEVEDAKGNKVFKTTLKTSEFGIASVDFQLADEVNMGDYQVRAVHRRPAGGEDGRPSSGTSCPSSRSRSRPTRSFYLPKETIKGELQGRLLLRQAGRRRQGRR